MKIVDRKAGLFVSGNDGRLAGAVERAWKAVSESARVEISAGWNGDGFMVYARETRSPSTVPFAMEVASSDLELSDDALASHIARELAERLILQRIAVNPAAAYTSCAEALVKEWGLVETERAVIAEWE